MQNLYCNIWKYIVLSVHEGKRHFKREVWGAKFDQKIVLGTWYLHERYAPFNLFSEFVSDFEKQSIANAIFNANPPLVYLKGKPKFRKLPNSKVFALRTQLIDLVGSEPHFFLDILQFKK